MATVFWRPVAAAPSQPIAAPTPQVTPTPAWIYVVQSGDTLYDIAQRHGLSWDLLAAANDLADPYLLTPGQQLIIPPVPEQPLPGIVHQVLPGDTLKSISLRYGVSQFDLIQDNHLLRPDHLVIGQPVSVAVAADSPPLYGDTHMICDSETLVGIAVEHNTSMWLLATVNELSRPFYASNASRMWIPGQDGVFVDWALPVDHLALHGTPAIQGGTISVQISVSQPMTLAGSLFGQQLNLFPTETGMAAVVGVDAMADPGLHTLAITVSTAGGVDAAYSQPIPLEPGEFVSEDIVVDATVAAAITPDVAEAELALVNGLFSNWSASRRWEGSFALPAAGDVTSRFGTRRTYNVALSSPYHTGVDLSSANGLLVTAPAAGIVVYTGTLTVRGNVLVLDHGWGVLSGYWHLAQIEVNVGDEVAQGETIGQIGSSGLSTGPHLHWEVRVGTVPVDGLQWLRDSFP
jgi:murein DD-endopeptidase MepM/ murein hydrolase activator NlpD